MTEKKKKMTKHPQEHTVIFSPNLNARQVSVRNTCVQDRLWFND